MPTRHRLLTPDYPIHITARTNGRQRFEVPLSVAWEVFSDYLVLISLMFGVRIRSFVMMPNHIHLIVRDPDSKLSEAMGYFMRETSKEIGRISGRPKRLWGSRYHSSVIGSYAYYLHAYKYVYRNPVKASLVGSPFHYRYSTLGALVGLFATAIPIEADETLFDNFRESIAWLERPHNVDEQTSIRRALRRRHFEFSRAQDGKQLKIKEPLKYSRYPEM